MQVFREAYESHPPLSAAQVRRVTMEKLGLKKMADASNELRTVGFNLEASLGKARCVRFKFLGYSTAVPVAAK